MEIPVIAPGTLVWVSSPPDGLRHQRVGVTSRHCLRTQRLNGRIFRSHLPQSDPALELHHVITVYRLHTQLCTVVKSEGRGVQWI